MNHSSHKIKVGLTTLGCKVNQCDSAAISEKLQAGNFQMVPFNKAADIYIINTCTVTAFADDQARQLIRRAKRSNPHARIIVTGCLAQTQARELSTIDGVTMIVGNDQKHKITELLSHPDNDSPKIFSDNIFLQNHFLSAPASHMMGRTRAFFKIQDGCDSFCSYCIVPFARGKSRSLPQPAALEGARALTGQGYREIVLTGIHLGNYGHDLTPKTDLPRILDAMLESSPDVRFRLSSIEPNEITDKLLDLFKRHKNLCPHLHIPLQSGDDGVLGRMKRCYNSAFYRSLVEKVFEFVADVAIGVDVMVGFPGETDEAFDHTVRLIMDLPVAYLTFLQRLKAFYPEQGSTPGQNSPIFRQG
ncbi:MAG: tRNA (N(6)-L-threonylcarbamoyladenosine(37)-C(2))-methylthiotransferase MtaB [Smithellaceae bacterium]